MSPAASLGGTNPDVLIVGMGDLGAAVAERLADQAISVCGLRRSRPAGPAGTHVLTGDVTRPETLTGLPGLAPQILLYCVSADAQSDASYRAHYVDGLRHVLQALHSSSRLKHVFFVSSTRVYGQSGDALLSEADVAMPVDFGGERLLEAERLLDRLACGHTVLRLSGIYGPGRRYLLAMAGEPSRWPAQNTWSNRIHRDDAAGFIAFLIARVFGGLPVETCYIVTDSCPVSQHEVLGWLAARLGVSVPACAGAPPAGGKRLSNGRLRATGFALKYPDYRAGYGVLTA